MSAVVNVVKDDIPITLNDADNLGRAGLTVTSNARHKGTTISASAVTDRGSGGASLGYVLPRFAQDDIRDVCSGNTKIGGQCFMGHAAARIPCSDSSDFVRGELGKVASLAAPNNLGMHSHGTAIPTGYAFWMQSQRMAIAFGRVASVHHILGVLRLGAFVKMARIAARAIVATMERAWIGKVSVFNGECELMRADLVALGAEREPTVSVLGNVFKIWPTRIRSTRAVNLRPKTIDVLLGKLWVHRGVPPTLPLPGGLNHRAGFSFVPRIIPESGN